ncbi:low molecular weight phosphatase family protein [Actinotalea ferrariae]|uniref:arsenate-mycothiol transferase ArsC n=1 Tax=Actinotalea ferrariae TaxID=1386098 RepID=UPI001C8CDCE7|nr:low molecular weight phosphatase family protein [Actinotalea ferrariae]MBX9243820.1 low molecular weight phosphatase family protein [Actinotalea ferrariae]
MTTPPTSVLFVCVHNSGKSQIAAAIARHEFPHVHVASAGTAPSDTVHPGSAATLAEVGIDITGEEPKPITDDLVAAADLVVVLGTEAQLTTSDGTPVMRWEVDEPSARGIEGVDRMRLVREDIAARVRGLLGERAGQEVGR